MKKKQYFKFSYILIFAIIPVIDSLNGFMLKSNIKLFISVGQLYRLILLAWLGGVWLKNGSKKCIKHVTYIYLSIILFFIIQQLYIHETKSIISEIMNIIQWNMIYFLIITYKEFNNKKMVYASDIKKIFNIWGIITPFTIIIPFVLKVGYSTYRGAGYKAFYYSTNAITYFLLITLLFNCFKLIKQINAVNIVVVLSTILALFMLGTKSAYVFTAIIIFLMLIIQYREDKKKGRVMLVSFVVLGLVLGIILATTYSEQLKQIYSRHSYFLENADSFISFITTERSDRIPEYFDYIKNNGNFVLRLLCGSGYCIETTLGAIEMDFFDAFFMFGIVGILFLADLILFIIRRVIEKKNMFVIIGFVISIIFSTLGGHVFSNAMASSCFALLCCSAVSND